MKTHLIFDQYKQLTIDEVTDIATRSIQVSLSKSPEFIEKIKQGARFVEEKLNLTGEIYGVTTGFGDNCTHAIGPDEVKELPINLSRFHGCGLGDFLTPEQTRAVIAIRLATLCRGVSGVSYELLQQLVTLLEYDILPLIPSEGSVGASGDLTPLSYLAGVILGERKVLYKGNIYKTAEVYKMLGIKPHLLAPKEALAIMNGTSVMTALATEVFQRAKYLVKLSAKITSMTCLALRGNPQHFNEALFLMKPHPGQIQVAKWIREDLSAAPSHFPVDRLQDRYSTRCAPHIIGVLAEMLPVFQNTIEIEMNSANDNPLVNLTDEDHLGEFLHGGHFYGGHIAYVMDSVKNLVANLADLLDRQLATLVDPKFNHGLPANLTGVTGNKALIHHGLKAVQIATSAWAAEALKQTMPASVFSRSTESHNQDKVSMGTIAARDALRVLELTEQVFAGQLIGANQALLLRLRQEELLPEHFSQELNHFIQQIKSDVRFIEVDRPLDDELIVIIDAIKQRKWTLYGESNV